MIAAQPIYNLLYTDKEHFIILVTGGRASGKSFNLSAFNERLTFEKSEDRTFAHTILYTRYTMVSAHMSIIPEMLEKIELDGTGKYFRATKTAHMKEVKKQVKEAAQKQDMDAYVMLSFDTWEAKANFCRRFGYDPCDKFLKGEVFDEMVERIE